MQVTAPSGYLLAAKFVQSSIIQEKIVDKWMKQAASMGIQMQRADLQNSMVIQQGSAPWMLCEKCFDVLNLSTSDKAAASQHAHLFWGGQPSDGYQPHGLQSESLNLAGALTTAFNDGLAKMKSQEVQAQVRGSAIALSSNALLHGLFHLMEDKLKVSYADKEVHTFFLGPENGVAFCVTTFPCDAATARDYFRKNYSGLVAYIQRGTGETEVQWAKRQGMNVFANVFVCSPHPGTINIFIAALDGADAVLELPPDLV